MKLAILIALVLVVAPPAVAQQIDIQKQAPPVVRERERDVIPPGLYEQTRPGDADHYPRGGRVQHDPAFIGPLSARRETPTSTGRVGVAGWVAPNTPVGATGAGWNEVSGWFAFGFSITWDGPPPARRPAP